MVSALGEGEMPPKIDASKVEASIPNGKRPKSDQDDLGTTSLEIDASKVVVVVVVVVASIPNNDLVAAHGEEMRETF